MESQVTISLLPVALSLVTIPRPRLKHLTTPVIHHILQPNPTFLNITCNELELSIFAEADTIDEFHAIARRDKHKQRARSDPTPRSRASLTVQPISGARYGLRAPFVPSKRAPAPASQLDRDLHHHYL